MPTLDWQKSSFSAEAANCVNVAALPDGTLHLRESDAPGRILAVNREGLSALLTTIKEHAGSENRSLAPSPSW
ncbi:DUF397 domain-containing protein [Streptomyces sp. CWNU-52B]|uniref:DUF397 domain-containing protein n=1 Tax=unclassified Streptomyces TaxID=2593676 RepID=UPI0039C42FA0